TIKEIVGGMGNKLMRTVGVSDDRPFMAFQTADGTYFATLATACHNDTPGAKKVCFGVQMIAELVPSKNANPEGLVEEFNATYAAAKFYYVDGKVRISRYLVLDDGVSRDNFKANVDVLLQIAGAVRKAVTDGA